MQRQVKRPVCQVCRKDFPTTGQRDWHYLQCSGFVKVTPYVEDPDT